MPCTCCQVFSESEMPPGAAILSIRAAILTPSPKISLPADIDANAELDRVASVKDSIVLANVVLDLDPAGNRVDGAGELYQHAIAHQLDDPARMGSCGSDLDF